MSSQPGVPLLRAENVSKSFGGLGAVQGMSLQVPHGGIVGLIGPNGAGKTTFFNVLSGFLRSDAGRVWFDGQDVTGWRSDRLARRGLMRTFQTPHVFSRLSLAENLLVARLDRRSEGSLAAFLRPDPEPADLERVTELLATIGLADRPDDLASGIAPGAMRLLEMVRPLMGRPSLLLLDEPMSGTPPGFQQAMVEFIRGLAQRGLSFLIIEHNLQFILQVSQVIYVMNRGQLLATGTPDEVARDPRVIEVYMGAKP